MTEKSSNLPPDGEELKQNGEEQVDRADNLADSSPEAAALQQKLEELENEKQDLNNRLLRMKADFDNYRKRTRAEKESLEEYANFNLIQKLLPVLDNLERASSVSAEAKEGVREGLAMILRQFKEILEKEGVVPMECRGEPFDPNCHEAVLQEKSTEYAPGTVLEEIQKGYMMKDKVLRVSMVKVSGE